MKMLDLLSEHNLAKQDVKGLFPQKCFENIMAKNVFFGIVKQF